MHSFHSFLSEGSDFLAEALRLMCEKQLPLKKHWHIDHLCFRVETEEEYESYKKLLNSHCRLLIESMVGGRNISTFKLDQPMVVKGRFVDLIELPAPKPNSPYSTGFEHLEIVMDHTFEQLKSNLAGNVYNESGLQKDFNADLAIALSENYVVKYHHQSLESVIALEANKKVFSAIQTSEILTLLKPYLPIITGTFPLNLANQQSDIDICIYSEDLSLLGEKLTKLLVEFDSLQVNLECNLIDPYLTASFEFKGVAFEIFGQKIHPTQQNAYRHFNLEERMLKLGGAGFREVLEKLRAKGYKTEPAFAKALNMIGNPYAAMLDYFGASDLELVNSLENRSVKP